MSATLNPDLGLSPEPLSTPEDLSWLLELLRSVQLEQFYVRIRDQLQVSRLEHFEFVQPEDLEKVGLARPAARRLLDLIKKKRRKALVGKLIPAPWQQRLGAVKKSPKPWGAGAGSTPGAAGTAAGSLAASSQSLTCLIHSKDITLQGANRNHRTMVMRNKKRKKSLKDPE